MTGEWLNSKEAAQDLGISRATFYEWLAQSNAGTFLIRGKQITIDYLQGGPKGQGRVRIERREVQRLLGLMRVKPGTKKSRRPPKKRSNLQYISADLGRPDD